MTPAARLAARDRQRRCRELKRQRKALYRVSVGGEVLDALVKWHWLREADATQPRCVSLAISAMLADAAQK